MTLRNRGGRPSGIYPHHSVDRPLLERAVQILAIGNAKSPTDAFRQLVGEDNDAHIRRLQRRWRRLGDEFEAEFEVEKRNGRWQMQSEALLESAPDLHERIAAFATSPAGAALLAQIAGRPLPPMAFGIKRLWDLISSTSPHGAAAADAAFTDALTHWSRFGASPDRAFLTRFAELCREQAETTDEDGE